MCPAKGSHNILKHNHQNSNSRPPYWGRKMLSNWRWTFPIGVLSKCAKSTKRFVLNLWERPMLCPERDKIRLGFHKCLGSRRTMLRPERNKIHLGLHKWLGSRRPMLCPERDKIRSGFHKVPRLQEAYVAPRAR